MPDCTHISEISPDRQAYFALPDHQANLNISAAACRFMERLWPYVRGADCVDAGTEHDRPIRGSCGGRPALAA